MPSRPLLSVILCSPSSFGFGPARWLGAPLAGCVFALAGCDTSEPLRMEASFELKGPITMQIQGPVVRYEGTFVSEALFEQVKESETSASWVLAAFGEPDRRSPLEDGSELMVWSYRLSEVEGSGLNIVDFGGENQPEQVTTILHIANGVVIHKWRG